MPDTPEHDESLEELLAEDLPPRTPLPSEGGSTTEATAKADESAPKPAPKPSAPAAGRKRSCWPTVVVILVVLLAAAVGLGWYATRLRGQVAALKGELETLKTQATGMEATAGNVADDMLPLIEEHATIAKLRATAGDAEGAKYSLMLAKRYADMAERLSADSPSSKLRGLKAQIEETEKTVGGGAAAAPAAEPATTPPEPAKAGGNGSPESGVQSPQSRVRSRRPGRH